jgi:Spy/CpxP family protein refolding chaperone
MRNLVFLKTITLWAFLLASALPAVAQPGGGPGGRRQFTEEDVRQRVDRIADSLDMTTEQKGKILAIELAYFKKNQEMRENFDPDTGDREAMREYMMKQREERMDKYAEVLTPEQMEKYTRMMERMRQNMRRRMEEQPGDRGRGRGRG